MNDMNRCITDDNNRKYGLWELKNETTAIRKCKCCNIPFERPITKGILTQIKKQYEALPLLDSFLNLSLNDPNLVGYLNVILEDVINYIDDNRKQLFNNKLHEINQTQLISDENKIMLENFRRSIKHNDNDLFFDTLEYFHTFNQETLNNFVEYNKAITK